MDNMNAFDRTVEALKQKGMSSDEILETLSQLVRELTSVENMVWKTKTTKELIEELTSKMGISTRGNGYRYLVRTIELYLENPRHLTKSIYPQVASEFDVKEEQVNREVWYRIKRTWESCPTEVKIEVFGTEKPFKYGKINCKQFLFGVCQWIKQQNAN